jgi:hypothetical protein
MLLQRHAFFSSLEALGAALENSKVAPFPPSMLWYTALTRLSEASGGDVFALARIAGRSSITITQRHSDTFTSRRRQLIMCSLKRSFAEWRDKGPQT